MTIAEEAVLRCFGFSIDEIRDGGSGRDISSARRLLVAALIHIDKIDIDTVCGMVGRHKHTVEYLVTRGVRMQEYKDARRNYAKAVSE